MGFIQIMVMIDDFQKNKGRENLMTAGLFIKSIY